MDLVALGRELTTETLCWERSNRFWQSCSEDRVAAYFSYRPRFSSLIFFGLQIIKNYIRQDVKPKAYVVVEGGDSSEKTLPKEAQPLLWS